MQATKELDSAKRIALYQKMQRLARERAPFAWMLQQVATAVLGKGVSGFVHRPAARLHPLRRHQEGVTQHA